MTDFTEALFEKKLLELRDSQKEIQSLSQFCVHYRQHSKIVVKVKQNSFPVFENLIYYLVGLVQKFKNSSSCQKTYFNVFGK